MDNPRQTDSSVNNSSTNKKTENTILIVEDDLVLSKMYAQKLSSEGFNVISAADGKEALNKFKKEKIDLVITDIMLPRMSGTEFLEQIRSTPKGKNVPVFVWTNLALEEEKRQALSLGANKYLVKESLTLDEVAELVKKYIN
jgi:DNA-binding response OmpR family regulator